jgi:alpha-tubulin suppressor-like RCC1 family protein
MRNGFRTLAVFSGFIFALPCLVMGADVISIWGGARETIVLKSDGTVWNWGLNTYGHLGDGTFSTIADPTNDKHVPIEVHGPGNVGYLNSIIAIMGGESHNFALKSDGTVWAWGQGSLANSIGDGTNLDRYTPVQVSNLSSIISLGGRTYHSLAIKSDGTA